MLDQGIVAIIVWAILLVISIGSYVVADRNANRLNDNGTRNRRDQDAGGKRTVY